MSFRLDVVVFSTPSCYRVVCIANYLTDNDNNMCSSTERLGQVHHVVEYISVILNKNFTGYSDSCTRKGVYVIILFESNRKVGLRKTADTVVR